MGSLSEATQVFPHTAPAMPKQDPRVAEPARPHHAECLCPTCERTTGGYFGQRRSLDGDAWAISHLSKPVALFLAAERMERLMHGAGCGIVACHGVVTAPESGAINVDMDASFDAPAPESAYASTKPGGPAATMMFESAAPARQDPVYSQANYSGDVVEEEAEDNSSSRYRPAPSRSRDKDSGKKSTSSRRVVRAAEPDDDDEVPSRGSGNKGKIIGVAAVVVAGLIGVAVVVLRPKDKPADEPATAPATKAEPLAEPVFVPPPPNPALAQPVPATPPSPRKGKAVEKPVHAEKPTPLEKPKAIAEPTPAPAHAEPKAEPKSAAGKPNEEDYRRANEAYQRGNSKLFQGNTSGAITDFNEALKLNPKDAASQRGLGLAYAQTGNNAEALKHLKLYLKVSPKANDRSIIEKRIDQLSAQ